MTKDEATKILNDLTKGESLLRHAKSVSLVMEAYAGKLGENVEEWAVAGLLHDADYEPYPDRHPQVIVALLDAKGENKIAHAISAHFTKWKVPYNNMLDKGLIACDEITGFIVACSQVRPDKINGLKSKSVLKKLKQKSFAASVDRDEVKFGVEIFEVDLAKHIDFIIQVLQQNKSILNLD